MPVIIDLVASSTATTFADLRTHLQDRGFSDLPNAQCDRMLNEAYQEICDLEDWPFLETTLTGASPLTVADLRAVTSVYDTATRLDLQVTTYDELVRHRLNVAQTGSPCKYYVDSTGVRTWPVGGTLSVRYLKAPAAMVLSTDVPVIPARFRDIIVTGAARLGAMDESAGQDLAAITAEYGRRLDVMRAALLDQSRDVRHVRFGGGDDW